jgi:hypothetical protein
MAPVVARARYTLTAVALLLHQALPDYMALVQVLHGLILVAIQ